MCKTYTLLFCIFQTFLVIKKSISHFYFIVVSLPYLHFHFFQRNRQFYSHWISHIPSPSTPLEQAWNKQRCTDVAVTAARISNCFFVCLLLKPSLKLSWLDWLEGLCKNLYLPFDSSQIPDWEDRETRGNLLFLLLLCFFCYIRDIWFFFFVSHTVWSPVTVRSLHLTHKSDENECYRLVDGSSQKASLLFHSFPLLYNFLS